MKKLVLAMVSILLMALFIAFNYLLWDRENRVKEVQDLELENASSSASMSLQIKENKTLQEENNSLQLRISQLQNDQEILTKSRDSLQQEKDRQYREMSAKMDLLNVLKGISDIKVFEQPVKAWVDAINAGEYDKAYQYEYASLNSAGNPPGLTTYVDNLKSTVKSISLKSAKLDETRGNDTGDIVLDVELDVKLIDKNTVKSFKDGVNQRFVKLVYDFNKKEFTISQISEY